MHKSNNNLCFSCHSRMNRIVSKALAVDRIVCSCNSRTHFVSRVNVFKVDMDFL